MDVQNIYEAALLGRYHHVQMLITQALNEGANPQTLLLNALIPAIDDIGRQYKQNAADITTLLGVARCVQKGMDLLSDMLDYDMPRLGRVILGTVEGDLHDVGKNLVAVMLRIYGFEVIDLGVDVSGKQFVRAALEHPDVKIICMSCLISTSMREMRKCVRLFKGDRRLAHLQIMVGGAPITQRFADEIGADIYTDNAVDAAEAALRIIRGDATEPML